MTKTRSTAKTHVIDPIAPDLKKLERPIADLHYDPSNARMHTVRNLDTIKASLSQFGQRTPIVVQKDGMIIRKGNGTVAAAKSLGWSHIAAVVLDDDNTTATAYAIADNRTSELADWDEQVLSDLLTGLEDDGWDLDGDLGFSDQELKDLLAASTPDAKQDDVPDTPEDPVTKPGDVISLGQHRVVCGDSSDPATVASLMDGCRADLMVIDPPYNVDYVGKTKDALKIQNDSMDDATYRAFLVSAFSAAFEVLKPGASFYIWHADTEGYNVRGAVRDCDQEVRQCLIWKKNGLVMGRQDYHWIHEPCLYGWKKGASHGWYTDRKQSTVLEYDRPHRSAEHPTMKPVELMAYQIGNSTAPQGVVLDTFLGSGSTLVASEQLGRTCYGIELDPAYCDVIVSRWETLTGKKAVREQPDDSVCATAD